jgi:P27 family predicted phage terminase small subunit
VNSSESPEENVKNNMTAGRKPKPTNLKLIQGTYRSDRANPSEPRPRIAIPPCPKFLQVEARKLFKETAAKLARIGLMTELDDMALSMLCQSWQEYLEATEQVRKTGILVKSPNGLPVLNPYLTVANQALKNVRSLLAEFGLTPSSRSRLSAVGEAGDCAGNE